MNYDKIKTLKKQVEYILEDCEFARNDDKELVTMVCRQFDLDPVRKASSIERCRRWFNQRLRFLPTDEKVARQRKINIDEWRTALGYPTEQTAGTEKPSWTPPSHREKSALSRAVEEAFATSKLKEGEIRLNEETRTITVHLQYHTATHQFEKYTTRAEVLRWINWCLRKNREETERREVAKQVKMF